LTKTCSTNKVVLKFAVLIQLVIQAYRLHSKSKLGLDLKKVELKWCWCNRIFVCAFSFLLLHFEVKF